MLFDLKVTLRLKVPSPSKMAASAALRQALLSSTVNVENYEIHEIAEVDEPAGDAIENDGAAEEIAAEVAAQMARHQTAKDAHRHGYGYDDPEAGVR